MSLVGERITVVKSSDPTFTGRKGAVVLETANTLLLNTVGRRVTLPKAGSVLLLEASAQVLDGNELVGRLEDRLRMWKR